MDIQDINTFYPSNRVEWRRWLEEHHQSENSIWLVYYKASTKKPSLSWSDAVDEALCFGWIDSTKKTIDEERYIQYFSRRKPKSMWSKINKDKVDHLMANKLMAKAGLESINIAKENGSWTVLDDVEALVIPKDLKDAMAKRKGATEFFEGLSKSAKKGLLHWVTFAKREETRLKRVTEVAENASKGLKPKQFR